MQTNGGHLIKYLRKKNGVTQAQLAEKLFISQRMLSNIEKGDAKLNIIDFKVAFATLGVAIEEDFWVVYLSEAEFEGYLQYTEIIQLLDGGGHTGKLQAMYDALAANPLAKYPLINRFLSYISVIVDKETPDNEKLTTLYATLRETNEHFEDEKITQYRLNFNEALIVHQIALTHARLGQCSKAIALLDGVVQNIESLRTTAAENLVLLPKLYTDLAVLLVEAAEYERAVPICESALMAARTHKSMWLGSTAAYLWGVCYYKLNKSAQEYMPLLTMAYHSAVGFRQNDLADKIRKEYDVQ